MILIVKEVVKFDEIRVLQKALYFYLLNHLSDCLFVVFNWPIFEKSFFHSFERSHKTSFLVPALIKKYLTRYTPPNFPCPSNLSLVKSSNFVLGLRLNIFGVSHSVDADSIYLHSITIFGLERVEVGTNYISSHYSMCWMSSRCFWEGRKYEWILSSYDDTIFLRLY